MHPTDVVPKDRLDLIRSMNLWEDGDVWPIGDGKFVEFEEDKQRFIVRKGDQVIASFSAKRFLSRR
jgi:hypothetical protein